MGALHPGAGRGSDQAARERSVNSFKATKHLLRAEKLSFWLLYNFYSELNPFKQTKHLYLLWGNSRHYALSSSTTAAVMFPPVLRGRCSRTRLLHILSTPLSAAVSGPPFVTSYDANTVFANTFWHKAQHKKGCIQAANQHKCTQNHIFSRGKGDLIFLGGGGLEIKARRGGIS